MKKIVRLEQTRIAWWMRWFYAIVATLVILAGIFLWVSIRTLSEVQAWDLLSLFSQDWEIIVDFWQDTVMTFVAELPIEAIIIPVVLFVLLIVVLVTRKRRAIIVFKQSQLAKHSGMSKNM